ncbi:MAG: hypothetical protein KAJ49_06495 [Arcobacteraceae bacterium]|nr:hypothetical protein [Arcobacteraceae bacterium]
MKKLIFAILSLGILFTSNVSADGHCKGWEHGSTQYVNDPEILGYFPSALEPYCWQVSKIQGIVNINDTLYLTGDGEYDGIHVQGRNDSYYNFFGYYENFAFGEKHRGIYLDIEVYGFPHEVPKVTFNHLPGVVQSSEHITSPSGGILNGTKYRFFMPRVLSSSVVYWSDLDAYGTVRIFDESNTLKREFTIF